MVLFPSSNPSPHFGVKPKSLVEAIAWVGILLSLETLIHKLPFFTLSKFPILGPKGSWGHFNRETGFLNIGVPVKFRPLFLKLKIFKTSRVSLPNREGGFPLFHPYSNGVTFRSIFGPPLGALIYT